MSSAKMTAILSRGRWVKNYSLPAGHPPVPGSLVGGYRRKNPWKRISHNLYHCTPSDIDTDTHQPIQHTFLHDGKVCLNMHWFPFRIARRYNHWRMRIDHQCTWPHWDTLWQSGDKPRAHTALPWSHWGKHTRRVCIGRDNKWRHGNCRFHIVVLCSRAYRDIPRRRHTSRHSDTSRP